MAFNAVVCLVWRLFFFNFVSSNVLLMQPKCHPTSWFTLTFSYSNKCNSILFYYIPFYSILFYSTLFKLNASWFPCLILYAPWSPGYNLQVLARAPRRPEKTLREWHADRCAPPPSLLLFPFELLPRRDDWHRAVHTANRSAPCCICIKWPHAIGLVRATANRLACHYRCLLLGGARGVLKIGKMCICFSCKAKRRFMLFINKQCCY